MRIYTFFIYACTHISYMLVFLSIIFLGVLTVIEYFCVTHVLNDTFRKRSNYVSVYKDISYKL